MSYSLTEFTPGGASGAALLADHLRDALILSSLARRW